MKITGLRISDCGLRRRVALAQSAMRNAQLRNLNQDGVVLIWVMFMVMALFAAASTLAIVMASSLRVAGSIDTGVPAFYAAESCVERAQYYLLQQDSALSRNAKVNKLNQNSPPAPAPPKTDTLTNGATWSRGDAVCSQSASVPVDPCEKIQLSCIGSFKGTNAGVSAVIE